MTRLQHLTALRDKVKAGEWSYRSQSYPLPSNTYANFGRAYVDGSLDAAKALHEALLPGWVWSVSTNTVEGSADAQAVVASEWQDASAFDDNPARAWLLAILSTLIAQEGGE